MLSLLKINAVDREDVSFKLLNLDITAERLNMASSDIATLKGKYSLQADSADSALVQQTKAEEKQ